MGVEKPNIFLHADPESHKYKARSGGSSPEIPERNRKEHGAFLTKQLQIALKEAETLDNAHGFCLDFTGQNDCNLIAQSLESFKTQAHVRILNIKAENGKIHEATVFVPKKEKEFHLKKIKAYATKDSSKGKPQNQSLVDSIADVRLADLSSVWMGPDDEIPTDEPIWCEAWLLAEKLDGETEAPLVKRCFEDACEQLGIPIDSQIMSFPETLIYLCKANKTQLTSLLSLCPFIAELRKAMLASCTYEDLPFQEQRQLVSKQQERISSTRSGVSVCLLDTGLNEGHPLLHPFVVGNGVLAWNDDWGGEDRKGHGTAMAGIALFGDLRALIDDSATVSLPHILESVKILPDWGANEPRLYGAVTEQSILKAEIDHPELQRIVCMAVTSQGEKDRVGYPSSWSSAVDVICANPLGNKRRLVIVSAGNVSCEELARLGYPQANAAHPVEDPAQAWNAITVGAYAQDITFKDHPGFQPVANKGGLCPYSSTSDGWDKPWPIKPDVLFDGGNAITNGFDVSDCEYMNLLTTSNKPLMHLFTHLNATSAATAEAARMAARLQSEYPEAWPETIRALIIHSATWTDDMKTLFGGNSSKKRKRGHMLRMCGYGIPDEEKAIQCMDNSVNMIIQNEIQPFTAGGESNDIHYYTLPWPKDILEGMGAAQVTLKITLSYFVEPAPGEKGWDGRYKYASCGLRFDVIHANEQPQEFHRRINTSESDEEGRSVGYTKNEGLDWYLGTTNRNVGSIHSDSLTTTAADLSTMNVIAVYPVIGWWRERKNLGCQEKCVPYSLVVSLSTPKTTADFYNTIINQISQQVTVSV
jgi:subtilisin family serine protease